LIEIIKFFYLQGQAFVQSQFKVLILTLSNGPICERFLLSPVPPEDGGRYSLWKAAKFSSWHGRQCLVISIMTT